MLIYFLLILIVFLDFSLEQLFLLKNKKLTRSSNWFHKIFNIIFKWRIISIIAFVIVFVIRDYSVGLDTISYKKYYDFLCVDKLNLFYPISSSWEVGFTTLNSLFALCGLSFRCVLLVVILFVMSCLVYFVNKVSQDKKMSFILFISLGIFAQALNTLRQIIAMAIIMLVLVELICNKSKYGTIKSIVLIFFASLFHVSALCCYIFLVAKYIKPKWWIIIALFCLTIIGSFLFPIIMKWIEKLTPLNYYSRYFVNSREFIIATDLVNNLYSLALISIFVIFALVKYKLSLNECELKQYDFALMIFIFVPLIRIAGYILNAQSLFNRVSMYPFIILIILIPLFLTGLKTNKKMYLVADILIYVVSFGYMYYLYSIKLSCGVVPYKISK